MNQNKVITKKTLPVKAILIKFFFGFLLPYVLINGIIFFILIQVPKVSFIGKESTDYDDSKIKFTINSIFPITSINTTLDGNPITYSKDGSTYIIDTLENGSYQINIKSLNGAVSNTIVPIEIKDVVAPAIDIDKAVITGNMLIFTIYDEDSEVNFESIYAITEDGEKINPMYIDMATGTVQFPLEPGHKLIVHVEDMKGNPTETTFTSNE